MKGTRYGDFSRFIDVEYDSVLMQQGRVQLDADWNAQVEAAKERMRRALADVLGGSCGPAHHTGYEIKPHNAVAFEGRGVVEVRDWQEVIAETGGQYTFELWLTWAGGPGTIVDCGRQTGPNAGFMLEVDESGALMCEVVCGVATPIRLAGDAPLRKGVRACVALVDSGDEVALYLDGAQLASAPAARCQDTPDLLVVGGARSGAGGFHGLFSGLRVWPHVRTVEQLAAGADVPLGDSEAHAGAVAVWLPGEGEHVLNDRVRGRAAAHAGDRPPLVLDRLYVEPGRYYVDGVLCELEHRIAFHSQPGCARQPLPARGRHLVFLETWDASIDAVEDPAMREVALGGVDTSVLSRSVSCVRSAPLHRHDGEDRAEAIERLLRAAAHPTDGTMAAEHRGESVLGNFLYRVEVQRSGTLPDHGDDGRAHASTRVVDVDPVRAELVVDEEWASADERGREIHVTGRHRNGTAAHARHQIRSVHPHEAGRQRLRVAGDVTELEDLEDLRVSRVGPPPTFKWSRRNGAETFAIAPVKQRARSVQLLGRPTPYEPLAPGDVVELLDARVPLDGPAHPLLTVESVSVDGAVKLSGPVPPRIGEHTADHPFLRRWDQRAPADAADAGGAIPMGEGWTELEGGIRVEFEPGRRYARGDYWWIVARQDLRSIQWPHEHGRPQRRRPDGVRRRVAPLALLDLRHDDVRTVDLRRTYHPAHERAADEHDRHEEHHHHAGDEHHHHHRDEHHHHHHHHEGRDALDFAIIGPAAAAPPHFTRTGVEVVTRPHWRRLATLDISAREIEGLASTRGAVIIATADALWRFDGRHPHRIAELPERRHGYAFCAVDELLVVMGGRTVHGRHDGRVYVYDLESGEWSERKRMPKRHEGHAAVPANGHVHVLGGRGRLWPSRAHHVHNLRADHWRRERALPRRRARAAAARDGSLLYVVGGDGWRGRLVRHQAVYDLDKGRWYEAAQLPAPHRVHGAAVHRGRHAVLVEHEHGHDHHVLLHDHGLARWDKLPHLPHGVKPLALVAHGEGFVALAEDGSGHVRVYEMRFFVEWEIYAPEAERPA